MMIKKRGALWVGVLGAVLSIARAQNSEPAIPVDAPYRDVTLAPEKRAANVVELMTLAEKFQLVEGHHKLFIHSLDRFGLRTVVTAASSAGVGIDKLLYGYEADSVAYPCTVGLAATWNREVSRAYGRSIAIECNYLGCDILLGPGFNLYRTASCGRNFEYFGEDPVHIADMVVPYVQGMQSEQIMATAKHFICNNHEWLRHSSDNIVDERTLHERYMYPWYFVVHEGKVGSVMSSYNVLNGEKVGQSKTALDGLLREEIGFDGLLMSDWYAVTRSGETLVSGQDLIMPKIKDPENFHADTPEETERHLNRMCQNILAAVFRFGIYDREQKTSGIVPDKVRKACEQVALQTAREGITLLKNNGILPLAPNQRILLLGPDVESTRHAGGGSCYVKGYDRASIGPELRRLLGEERFYSKDWKTVDDQTIREAELIIVCVDQYQREHGDQIPVLEESQENLVKRCATLNPRTVVVVCSGSGLEMDWADSAAAILWPYYPGQYGGRAVAEILVGTVNPSGKLPFSIERKFSDSPAFGYFPEGAGLFQYKDSPVDMTLPDHPKVVYKEGVFCGYCWYDEKGLEVRFPFGHGLSYTTFTYDKLKVKKQGGGIVASATIKNTGDRAGSEIVQLYIGAKTPSVPRPIRELKAFEKVELAPGESKTVKFRLSPVDLAFYDTTSSDWKVEPGQYVINLAASSRDIRGSKTLEWKKELHYKRPSDSAPVK